MYIVYIEPMANKVTLLLFQIFFCVILTSCIDYD